MKNILNIKGFLKGMSRESYEKYLKDEQEAKETYIKWLKDEQKKEDLVFNQDLEFRGINTNYCISVPDDRVWRIVQMKAVGIMVFSGGRVIVEEKYGGFSYSFHLDEWGNFRDENINSPTQQYLELWLREGMTLIVKAPYFFGDIKIKEYRNGT